jgi:large subunit ribosomal protein L14e|tara:strand:+ start:77 stop:466 length:390 start_codon:yes stop_codon:yes gene_type:complete
MKVGQICVKTTGRDAGKRGVVLGVEKHNVLLDGEVRRRKVNIMHLLPTDKTVPIKKDASAADVKAALKKIGITIKETKPKKAKPRPVRDRTKKKAAPKAEPAKPATKAAAKAPAKPSKTAAKPAATAKK